MSRFNIVNVGYDATNYYVVADTKPRLLVDVGMPGTLPKLLHQCMRMDINLAEVDYLLCTHYHPDHAGIVEEVKRLGIKLIVCEQQFAAMAALRALMKSRKDYMEIDPTDSLTLHVGDSHAFFAKVGIEGEVISTPGHSDDSITLVLDQGAAFIGDLPHPHLMGSDSLNKIDESWQEIRTRHVKTIYPGHGQVQPLRQFAHLNELDH